MPIASTLFTLQGVAVSLFICSIVYHALRALSICCCEIAIVFYYCANASQNIVSVPVGEPVFTQAIEIFVASFVIVPV